jgi:hypothetical protein
VGQPDLLAKRLGATWWLAVGPVSAALGLYLALNQLLPFLKHDASLAACSKLAATAPSSNAKDQRKNFGPDLILNFFAVDCSKDTVTFDMSMHGFDSQLFHGAADAGSVGLRQNVCSRGSPTWGSFFEGGGMVIAVNHMLGEPPYVVDITC